MCVYAQLILYSIGGFCMRVFQHGHDLSTKEKREKHSILKLKGFHTETLVISFSVLLHQAVLYIDFWFLDNM